MGKSVQLEKVRSAPPKTGDIDDAASDWPADQIRLTTRYAIMHTIPQIFATIVLFIVSDPTTAFAMSLFILAYVPTYFAHWRRWPLLGRVWSPIAGMATVAAFHIVMGPEWDISMILLSQVVLPFCIFTQEERGLTLLFALLPAILFVVLKGFVTWGPFVTHNLTQTQVRWFSMLPPTVACIDIYTRIRLLLDRIQKAADESNRSRIKAVLANRAKSSFLANMSHEIRTPMNAVVAMSDLLRKTKLGTEQQEMVETIASSANGLIRIINDILDYSKIEAGELSLRVRPFDLHECLDDVISVLALKAEEKRLELGMVVSHRVPLALEGDPDRLKQVLFNLIGNAIKYTEKGYVHIRVASEGETPEAVRLRIAVSDSGIGIREADLERVFDSFVQADTSTTRQYGGTGLGLAISRQIISMFNGDIAVESAYGKGSVFRFTAGFRKQAVGESVKSEKSSGKRTLVVAASRNSIFEEGLRELLRRVDCEIVATLYSDTDGDMTGGGLERYHPIDLVMGECDGRPEALRRLWREITTAPRSKGARMIIVKRPGLETCGGVSYDAGVGTVFKPLKLEALARCVTTLFATRTSGTGVGATKIGTLGTEAPVSAPAPVASGTEGPYNPPRVLVVEDNRVNQLVASKILEKLGYACVVADNGQKAVDILKEESFDVVLMDQQMPVLDGISATKLIRVPETGALNPLIPIVAVTASAMKGDQEQFLEAGMNDYLAKPIVPQALAELLERWIGKSRRGQKNGVNWSA